MTRQIVAAAFKSEIEHPKFEIKKTMLFFLIFILSLATSYILPWWAVAIIAFVAPVYAGVRPGQAFWSGFGAVFFVWLTLSLFKSIPNDHILVMRVAALFGLPNWLLLLGITAFIGGLVGGLSSLSGYYVKRVFEKEPELRSEGQ